MTDNLFEGIIARDNSAPGDYEKGGLLICGKCHAPKQRIQRLPQADGTSAEFKVPRACLCADAEEQAEREDKAAREFEAHMRELQELYHVSDETYRRFTFAADDLANKAVSNTCRRYVARWPEIRANNLGILFCGPTGTGKSFYACAITNALREQRVPATVTNFPRLLNIIQGVTDKQAVVDHLQRFELLVIDDLGAERDSRFGLEQLFNVIDSRARAKLPLIVTTNVTLEELKDPPTQQLARIYDRVLEMCPIQIKLAGESRRKALAERRAELARALLRG